MISIVLVSHSQTLVQGVQELIRQMVQDRVPVATAGGTDNPDEPIGTDPMKVCTAIRSVYSDAGVLVIMDLGSALLSAETAVEFLEPEAQKNIYLCEVPFVEGSVAAAVAASGGGTIEFVISEAREALENKTAHLLPVMRILPPTQEERAPSPSASRLQEAQRTIIVPNRLGLHARPAARLVSVLAPFRADVTIQLNEKVISARSLNKLMTLGARHGDELLVRASGPDAQAALKAVEELAAANFGDRHIPRPKERPGIEDRSLPTEGLKGTPASPGIGVGPAFLFKQKAPAFNQQEVKNVDAEWQRLHAALNAAQDELRQFEQTMARSIGAEEAAIFQAQRLMLSDPDLLEQLATRLNQTHLNAEAVWKEVIQTFIEAYLSLDNHYLRRRAADLEDVGYRVLRLLSPDSQIEGTPETPSVLVASDLSPSETARLDPTQVVGLLLGQAGPMSHSVVFARALGIPAVVGLGSALDAVCEHQVVGLDGTNGWVWLTPAKTDIDMLHERRATWLSERRQLLEQVQRSNTTRDGKRIRVLANIGGLHDALSAAQNGAEGVGLFRTEYLYMQSDRAPSEDEQLDLYVSVAETFAGAPVTIRTLDAGGDKPIPHLSQPTEENPVVGRRGIRYSLAHRALFKTQLKALLRTAADHHIRVMLPMISIPDEVRQTKEVLREARDELVADNVRCADKLELGIMVETPAAVWNARTLAQEVGFFSIGTNDLTQYIMAADRGNANVARMVNPLHPPVLQAIHHVVKVAREIGIPIGMCGEMAGNPQAVALLVGLGLEELSVNAVAVPQIKRIIGTLSAMEARQIAEKVLMLDSIDAVESFLSSQEAH